MILAGGAAFPGVLGQVAEKITVDDGAAEAIAAAAEVYGGMFAEHTIGERDPFRNPIGHTLRVSLTVLVREFFGAMQPTAIDAAFADIMALRSIQALAVEQRVRRALAAERAEHWARQSPGLSGGDADAE